METIQEQEWSPILGYKMYFSENDEKEKGETERAPAQQPNTGDWGDESEWDNETDAEENSGNDNSGGAGSTGSAATNS